MPIWLRKFTFSEIDKFYREEKSSFDNAQNGGDGKKNMINPDGKINTPDFASASKPYKGKTSYK
tara:strand:+ start:917 stop:1108 length:192 start_codon:yes stop_codon:yes gene_type:complete